MTIQTQIDLSKYIEVRIFGERPHIRGRRIPIATIVYAAQSEKWDVAELAVQFTLTEAEVLAAILYYEQHHLEIDDLEQRYQAELDEAYEQFNTVE
jgi:uncharacterized protein (DUF433 family)